MRAVTFFSVLIMGATALVLIPAVGIGQFQPGGGRMGGKGGNKGGGTYQDPNAIFDFLAKGRTYFLASESRLNAQLTQYAQEKGVTNGQITRTMFLDFQEQMKAKMASATPGGFPPPAPGGGFKGGFPGGKKKFGEEGSSGGAAPALSPEVINAMADLEFQKRDRNSDGKLVPEEMPPSLRGSFAKYDKNGDGMLDKSEFREYFAARMQGADDGNSRGAVTVVNDEEELDRKPTVYRVGGKMPPGLPAWFKELDTDKDGQVALYEWRKASKPMDEFKDWDANNDGFITPEEAAKHQMSIAAKEGKTGPGGSPSLAASLGGENGGRPAFGMDRKGSTKGGFPGGTKGGFPGMGKGKKKSAGGE